MLTSPQTDPQILTGVQMLTDPLNINCIPRLSSYTLHSVLYMPTYRNKRRKNTILLSDCNETSENIPELGEKNRVSITIVMCDVFLKQLFCLQCSAYAVWTEV